MTLSDDLIALAAHVEQLEQDNDTLKHDNERMRDELRQYAAIRELIVQLQPAALAAAPPEPPPLRDRTVKTSRQTIVRSDGAIVRTPIKLSREQVRDAARNYGRIFTAQEMAEDLDVSRGQIDRYLEELEVIGTVRRLPFRWEAGKGHPPTEFEFAKPTPVTTNRPVEAPPEQALVVRRGESMPVPGTGTPPYMRLPESTRQVLDKLPSPVRTSLQITHGASGHFRITNPDTGQTLTTSATPSASGTDSFIRDLARIGVDTSALR